MARDRGAAVVFACYWMATVVVVHFAPEGGIPTVAVALLLSSCAISGALIGWWCGKSLERTYSVGSSIRSGAFAGMLVGVLTLVVMKGGVIAEVVGWMRGLPHFGQWDEALGFILAVALLGGLLGSMGAACSAILQRRVR